MPGNAEIAKARIVADAADKYAAADQMALAGLEQRPPVTENAPLEERQEAAARDASDVEVMDRDLPGDPEEVRERLSEVLADFPGARFEIVDEWSDDRIARISAGGHDRAGRISAFYDDADGVVYFNTSLLRPSQVDEKIVHEIFTHQGIREVLGPERAQAFFRNLYEAFKDDPDMPGVIRKYELADVDDYDDLKTEDMTDAQKSEAGEEFGAKLAEESLKPEAQRAPWYERALFKLRELLRKLFPKLRISRRDLETLLREAAHKLRRGQVRQSKAGDGEGTRYAVNQNGESIFKIQSRNNSLTVAQILNDPAISASEFILDVNGNMDWAQISPDVANAGKKFGVQALPIRLRKGRHVGPHQGFGLAHLDAEHGEYLRTHGYQDFAQFLTDVFDRPAVIYARSEGSDVFLEITTKSKPQNIGVLQLQLQDGCYSIVTAFPRDVEHYRIRGSEVWRHPASHSVRPSLTDSTVNTNAIQQATSRTKSAADAGSVADAAVPANSKPAPTIHPFGEKSSGEIRKSVEEDVAAKREREFADSKVRGEDGKLLPVYHDTNAKIYVNKETGENWDDLDWMAREEWEDRDDWGEHWVERDFYTFSRTRARRSIEYPGFFFSPTPDPHHEYGSRRIAAYLNITNPAIDPVIENAGVYDDSGEAAMKKLIEQGYDGVIRTENGKPYEYIAFYPEQIKLADDVTYDDNGDPIPPEQRYDLSNKDIRFAIEDEDDAPLVEPKPFDPDRDVDYEDPDERAIAVLIPRYGAAAEFDDDEAADYLHGAGFDDVTPQQAHKLVARAREAYRKQRTDEIRHNNARRRDDWLYDNVPLYRHAVDFGGKGFRIRMPKDYAHKDDRGTLLAKPNEPGIDLIELAKYIGRVEERPNEEKEIAEELADFYRDLKLPDLYRMYHDAVKETKEGEREIDRQAKEEFARYLEDSARDLIERGEPVTREALEDNRRLAALLYDWILGKPLKGKISNADIDDINAALQNHGGNPRLVARISRAIREDLKAEYTERMRDFRDKLRSEIRDAKAMAKEAEKMLREFIPPQYRGRYVDDLVKLANITNGAARQVEFDKLCQKITEDSQTAGGADLAAKVTKDKIYFELPKGERDRYLARLASIMKLTTPEKRIEAFDALQQEVMDAADAVRKVKYLDKFNARLAQLTPKVNKSRRLIGTRTIEAQDSIAEIARVFSLSSAEVDDERQAAIEGQEAALDNGDAEGAAECMAKAKLLDVFGVLASRSGDEVYKAYDQLERIAATGRNDLLREIAEWQAGIDKIQQAVIRKVTSGRGVVTDKAAYDIRTKHNESKLAKLKEYAWGMFKPEDFIYLTAINGERGDWLENPIGKMFVRMHEISVEVAARMMAFQEADGKAMDAAFGTKGEVGRARALQAFKEHRDDWGVTRLPASTRQIEFIPVTIDEARRLVAAFDRGERAVPTSEDAAHTLPIAEYQAEMLRARLRDLDRHVKKEYNGQNSDKITRDIFNAMDAEDREKHGEQKTIGIPVVRFTGRPEAWDYTGEELLDEYLYWNQPDVRAKMQMNGWTEESGKQLAEALPDELKKYGEHMVEELRKIGEELDRIQQRTAHSRMTHVENYFPTVYDKPFWSEGNVPALDDKYASRMAPGRLAPGSLKERVAHTMEPKAIPAIAAYHEQMRRMIHYTGWAEFARDARAVFFHPDVKSAYDQTFGPEFYKAFSKSLVDTFNGGNADVSYNAFAQGILGAETSARMMFNWLSGIKQSLSGFAQLHDVPTADFFKSLVDAWTHPHEWIKDMADTPYFKVRLKNGADYFEYIALDSRNRYAAEAKSFGKAGKMLHLDAGKLAAAAQMLQITKYWSSGFTRLGDMFPCVVFGAAVYRYHYNRMIEQGFSPEEAKQHALLRWEISVDSLQQSPFVLNQNQWQRGGWATQMWTRWKTAQIENEQRVKRAGIAALVYGNGWTEYNTYLDVRIEDGKMLPVTDAQYKKLVKFYNDFPLGESVVNKWGERLIFAPLDPDGTEEYIHHFAVKRKGDKEEYFDEEYLELFKKLKPSLKNPDERLLTATKDGISRIVYIKKIPTKNGNHVMVVNVASDGRLLNWTHMDSKDAYVENLREREREAVEKFGLVDENGRKLNVGYDEYMRKKADMRAYLAATQCPPSGDPQTEHTGDNDNIPPGGEKSSGKFYTGATHMSYREQIVRGFFINWLTAFLIAAVGGAIMLKIRGKKSREDHENMLLDAIGDSVLSSGDMFPIVGDLAHAVYGMTTAKGESFVPHVAPLAKIPAGAKLSMKQGVS